MTFSKYNFPKKAKYARSISAVMERLEQFQWDMANSAGNRICLQIFSKLCGQLPIFDRAFCLSSCRLKDLSLLRIEDRVLLFNISSD